MEDVMRKKIIILGILGLFVSTVLAGNVLAQSGDEVTKVDQTGGQANIISLDFAYPEIAAQKKPKQHKPPKLDKNDKPPKLQKSKPPKLDKDDKPPKLQKSEKSPKPDKLPKPPKRAKSPKP
jgi:hypothetical protein